MSFRTSCPVASSPFELLRRSFLQADGLTFGNALNAEQIEQAFSAEGVCFSQPGGGGQPPVYTMAVTLWAMVSQALFSDLQRSCRAAVLRVAVYYALLGRQVSTNTGAYCRARAKIGEGVVRRLTEGVARRCRIKGVSHLLLTLPPDGVNLASLWDDQNEQVMAGWCFTR